MIEEPIAKRGRLFSFADRARPCKPDVTAADRAAKLRPALAYG